MNDAQSGRGRRQFLKTAGVLVAGAACSPSADTPDAVTTGADTERDGASRMQGFAGPTLTALGDTMLPAALGADGQRAAVTAFVQWCAGYEPVAEEMHGYGYADVRYLPPDPVPAWRAQLDALELLAQRVHHRPFVQLEPAARQALVGMATRSARGDRLPSPLAASHVALALLAHWASTPDAWNRAFGVEVSPATCRTLGEATQAPRAIPGNRA